MIPQKQTRKSPRGDCERAVISSLLEIPITDVPDFTNMREDPDAAYPIAYLEKQAFLRRHGYAWFEVPLKNMKWPALPFAALCIFKGTHISGEPHAIIGEVEDNVFRPVYDPLEPEGVDVEVFQDGKIDSVAFLVPLDPAKFSYNRRDEPAIIRLDGNN